MKKIICLFIAALLCCLSFAACDKSENDKEDKEKENVVLGEFNVQGVTLSEQETDYVAMRVKGKGDIVIKLFPEIAPITVKNFKKLVSEKFYDGLIFHRVIENFMIQGGDPDGNGTGGADETIYGEFAANGFNNNLLHKRGVVSMARSDWPNSASSQFFILHVDYPSLDGNYASFGYVVHGLDVVDDIATVATDYYDKPTTDVVIEWVRFANVEEGTFTVPDRIFDSTDAEDESESQVPATPEVNITGVALSDTATDYVVMRVRGKGDIIIKLFPDVAPVTVENFKKLVSMNFYDGLIFHRVIEDFMIQGGAPKTNVTLDKIYGEFASNGFDNQLLHKRGVISMARATAPDSASSQFFIMHADYPSLDGAYASFGYAVYGLDVVDAIATADTYSNDRPKTDVVIDWVRFVTVEEGTFTVPENIFDTTVGDNTTESETDSESAAESET